VDASPQMFHKMNSKVSQQRSGPVSGRFTAKVSQNEFQSFAAKVRSCQWRLLFTAKVSQNELQSFATKFWSCQWTLYRKSFTKLTATFYSKGPVLSVDASAAQQRSSNVSVDRDVYLVLEILGQKLLSGGSLRKPRFRNFR